MWTWPKRTVFKTLASTEVFYVCTRLFSFNHLTLHTEEMALLTHREILRSHWKQLKYIQHNIIYWFFLKSGNVKKIKLNNNGSDDDNHIAYFIYEYYMPRITLFSLLTLIEPLKNLAWYLGHQKVVTTVDTGSAATVLSPARLGTCYF